MSNRRTIRTSVPDDAYRELERLARTLRMSVAEAARFAIAFGLAAIEAAAEREASRG